MAFTQGWCLLSSVSITSGHCLRAATIKGAAFNQVNTVLSFFSFLKEKCFNTKTIHSTVNTKADYANFSIDTQMPNFAFCSGITL